MLLESVRMEIVELHAFFVDWSNGTVAREKLQPRFLSRLDPDVVFISPDGRFMSADDLSAGFQKGYATSSEFTIQIRDVALRRELGDWVLAIYTEWQIGAITSVQADNVRVTTVLMRKGHPSGGCISRKHGCPKNESPPIRSTFEKACENAACTKRSVEKERRTMTERIAYRPREIADCVGADLQEGDMEGIVSMFHPDCHVYFPPDQPPSAGLAGVRNVFEGLIGVRPEIQSDVISEVIIGDIAPLCADLRALAWC